MAERFVEGDLFVAFAPRKAAGEDFADFADYVVGRRNERAGCEVTATFDRGLAGDLKFRVLS